MDVGSRKSGEASGTVKCLIEDCSIRLKKHVSVFQVKDEAAKKALIELEGDWEEFAGQMAKQPKSRATALPQINNGRSPGQVITDPMKAHSWRQAVCTNLNFHVHLNSACPFSAASLMTHQQLLIICMALCRRAVVQATRYLKRLSSQRHEQRASVLQGLWHLRARQRKAPRRPELPSGFRKASAEAGCNQLEQLSWHFV